MNQSLGLIALLSLSLLPLLSAADTVSPYTAETVARSVTDLWADVDARKEPLETEVVKEWREDGIVTRYVIFKVGTFKGADSRIAAFYTFPEGMKKGAAFVWSHGGGQRAERERGTYFAKHGFATVDINWNGREMVEGVDRNTDWGRVDPTQGERFYPKALRPGVKLDLSPDPQTIDPVVSPRNGNWYLLTLAARRAITFLEQQPEVDPEKIGFTGFSMGGQITSMVAIDPRLKAVVPMVGGSGFITRDLPGLPGTARNLGGTDMALYAATNDSESYWPLVKCPVLFLSASDDFNAPCDDIYRSMALLPHDEWRVGLTMHANHALAPEQWILLNLWFDRYLKGDGPALPKTAKSSLAIDEAKRTAVFTVQPDQGDKLVVLDVYFSHDPNPRARFWKTAKATEKGGVWTADLELRDQLPLFVFANCTYPLPAPRESFEGTAKTFAITSREEVFLPARIDVARLREGARPQPVFEDFAHGTRDWSILKRGDMRTFKFQDPSLLLPAPTQALRVKVNAPRELLSVRLRIEKNKFLTGIKAPAETYSAAMNINKPGAQELIFRASDFRSQQKAQMTDWEGIATLTLEIYDGNEKRLLDMGLDDYRSIVSKMEWLTE